MIHRFLPLLVTSAVLVVGFLLCAAQFPNFASLRVVGNLLTDNAFLGITAVGMTFVILSGGIDLSVGAVIGFTTVLLAVLIEQGGWHPVSAFAVALAVAGAFGAAMGAVIHVFQMPPFIVTLAGMFVARGLGFVLSTDSIPINHPLYAELGDLALRFDGGGKLTLPALLMLGVVAAAVVCAHWTRFGANLYALGGNRQSAELMGVPVGRTTVAVYALSGLLAGLAGIVFSLYTGAGYSLAATGVELDTITAVVIGGTQLTGGYGYVIGTFIGVLIQGLIQTYITFDGSLSSWWTKIAIGVLLFVFILLQKGLLAVWTGRAGAPAEA
ncbi:sugar ABC transporter permease YjfF [Azospirillum formosense]|uniref:Sugar ABC transporter permease YjfF n=1 Tax=Azospirillum formosense TaxID=861533 RepID=A0ABX2L0W4_9PROT|nr:galactofuranose ABC transporter, permease protein YjfF [Azospirillum formosense]MBY3756621.1 sugar ABC transporter permease YjfF [Azospirillum formosense]NUB21202.1 sugar ABC transporter permease YjfF [Azospirillum formosense]